MSTPLPASSAIPGALIQMLAIAKAALPADTTIWWGKELSTYTSPLTFQITEITGDQQPAEMGPGYRREETFSLVCSLSSYQGGDQGQGALDGLNTVMLNFALISAAIGNNPNLNQAVRFAQVGNFIISTDTDGNGTTAVTLDFQVRCEQRVLSLASS
jgi:hypothetical protein